MILVTGAGGFIGRHVCRMLAAHCLHGMALDRRFSVQPPLTALEGDITEANFLAVLFRQHSFAAIIHLAGVLNTASRQRPEDAIRVNIGASLHLLRLAVEHRVPKFVFGSSISAYGPKPYSKYGAVSESEPASLPATSMGSASVLRRLLGRTTGGSKGLSSPPCEYRW